MAKPKRGLGRGLDALLGMVTEPEPEAGASEQVRALPVEQIVPGKYQPRSVMDPDKLAELAASIKAQGLVQPVVVRPIGRERYELIAGERRWRAAQMAELREIPAIVRAVPDQAAIALALIENIQREDLSALEEASALQRLIEEFALTHQQAAEAVGRSRAAVSNLLRLLELPAEVRRLIEQKQLEMGHARALLSLAPEAQRRLAEEAVAQGLSVREVEQRVRRLQQDPTRPPERARRERARDPDLVRLETELSERLAAPVTIEYARGRGKLIIGYHSLDELDGILARIR